MAIWLVQDGEATEVTADTRGQGDPGTDWILVRASSAEAALNIAESYDSEPTDVRWKPEDGPYDGAREGVWNVWRWVTDDGRECDWLCWEDAQWKALRAARWVGGHQIQHGRSGEVVTVR